VQIVKLEAARVTMKEHSTRKTEKVKGEEDQKRKDEEDKEAKEKAPKFPGRAN